MPRSEAAGRAATRATLRAEWAKVAVSVELALPIVDEQCARDGCNKAAGATCMACRYVRCAWASLIGR